MNGRGCTVQRPVGAEIRAELRASTALPQQTVTGSIDRIVDNLQKRVSDLTARLGAVPFEESVYRRDVTFTAGGANELMHGLGVEVAWYVTKASSGTGYPLLRETSNTTSGLTLQAEVACTVDVWMFRRPGS